VTYWQIDLFRERKRFQRWRWKNCCCFTGACCRRAPYQKNADRPYHYRRHSPLVL